MALQAALEEKKKYPFIYDPARSEALKWLNNHAAELVTNLAQEQINALNAIVYHFSGYESASPDEVARQMRAVIGLTRPQAIANARYYESVKTAWLKANPKGRMSTAEKYAREAAAKYAGKQHRYRAKCIARTELAFGYNAGLYGAAKDAQTQGYIGECRKRWVTAHDGPPNRVCVKCASLDGMMVGMDDYFPNNVLIPPGHPQCRCVVDFVETPETITTSEWSRETPCAEFPEHHTEERIQNLTISEINGIMGTTSKPNAGDMTSRGITDGRNLAMGYRTPKSHILTDEEIESLRKDAEAIEMPIGILKFNEGTQTGFRDRTALIYIRGDILPDKNSLIARDRMSTKAVLAHEYYGHYKHHPSEYDAGDWRDEFRASYIAATDAPNLSDEDRALLMIDAYDRAKEAGIILEYDEKAKKIIYGY